MDQSTLPYVKELADQLTFQEQLILLQYVAQRLRLAAPGRQPHDLYGAFKGRFPEELDVDKALREIRTAWKRDLDDITGTTRQGP